MQKIVLKIFIVTVLIIIFFYSINQALTFKESENKLFEIEVGSELFLVFPGELQFSSGNFIRFICINPQAVPYIVIVTDHEEYAVEDIVYSDNSNKFGMIRITDSINYQMINGLRINGHYLEIKSDAY